MLAHGLQLNCLREPPLLAFLRFGIARSDYSIGRAVQIAQILIENGANLDDRNRAGETLFQALGQNLPVAVATRVMELEAALESLSPPMNFTVTAPSATADQEAAGAVQAAAGGGGAEASYNQGVILFNAGKFAEAKTQFEAATIADQNMAMAYYQLGMTSLSLGLVSEAISALEAYLKVDSNGSKAAEVRAALPALQAMLKK
jgi:tetratricopeptide (TPR) repeat protein